MLLFPLALVLGMALGRLRGGRVRHLAYLQVRAPGLVVGAAVLQVAATAARLSGMPRLSAFAASYALVGVWLVANFRPGGPGLRAGFACVAVGYALNMAATLPNGSMPVSTAALAHVGGSQQAFVQGPNLDKHVAATSAAVLASLGDVVPVPVVRAVVSVGDVVLLLGVVAIVIIAMAPPTLQLDDSEGRP